MNTGKKKSVKPVRIFTLDTETRGLFGQVFRVGLFDGNNYIVKNSFHELQPILYDYSTLFDCHIYIHNLDFDLSKIAHDVVPDGVFDNSIFINNNVALFSTTDLAFHDSFKILPSSLEKLCKSFKLKDDERKVDLQQHIESLGWAKYYENGTYNKFESEGYYFEHVEPDEDMLNIYLENDCRSLHTIIMQVVEISGLDLEEFVMCPTTASLAMKVFRTNYPDDYDDAISSIYLGKRGEFAEGFLRFGYYGGRTEVFQPILENGYHYDVNSLYPYVMKTHEFPIGYYEIHTEEKDARQSYLIWKNLGNKGGGFLEANIYVPEDLHIPPLPYRDPKGGKLLFPVGKLHGVWTFPEIALAERMGCKIEKYFQSITWNKTYAIFREYVEYWEHIKNTSKGAKREFAKLMLNSLYGKFGMQRIRPSLVDVTNEEKYKKEQIPYIKYKNDKVNKEFIQVDLKSHAKYIQVHLAAYVTSLARIHLYEGLIHSYEKGEVSYCDTDSIACGEAFEPELIHDKEFGKWKLEGQILKGIFLQPKLYAEMYKPERFKDEKTGEWKYKVAKTIRAKGVPKDELQKMNFDLFEEIYKKILHGEKRIELFEKKEVRKKFATMLKNNENFDKKQVIRKGINLLSKQKRQMNYKENYSKPHVITEYGMSYKDYLKQQELKEKELYEAELKKVEESQEFDVLKENIKIDGFIKCIEKGEQYFEEYKHLSRSAKAKYFRKRGLPLDVWLEGSTLTINEFWEKLI